MFEVGSLVRSTRETSWFYDKVMQLKEHYEETSRIYPVNNGDIQEYKYFLDERGYSIDHRWLTGNEVLEQVNEDEYYKDRYI